MGQTQTVFYCSLGSELWIPHDGYEFVYRKEEINKLLLNMEKLYYLLFQFMKHGSKHV